MLRFVGCLIEESLTDPTVVADWAPFAERVAEVPEDPDAKVWHLRWYQVEEAALNERLERLAAVMKPQWYGHFWAGERLCVILAGRVFWLPANQPSAWEAMIAYGESVGIERRWTERVPTTMPAWAAEALATRE